MTSTAINWTEKYKPKYFADIKGQEEAVAELRKFIGRVKRGSNEQKAIVLHGPPGTGKTAIAYAAANEVNAELFELNASDLRNNEKLNLILKPATEHASLTKKNKVILVDEIDGISGEDESGLPVLVKLIDTTSHPIIMTANDVWNRKFSELRKKTHTIKFKEIDYRTIKDVLIEILKREKKFIDSDILTNIAIKSRGDLRAAINDIQTAASLPDSSKILIDERNKETDIFSALRMIFKGKPNNTTLRLFDSVNKPMDEILLWIEENIPTEYNGIELARAFDILSKADIFKKRINRQQYWRLLVYQNALLSYGISSSKKNEKTGFTSYRKPTRILKMWMNNQRTEKKKKIAKKYARYVHVGEKRALKEFSTIRQFLFKPEIQAELRLSEDEIEYLNNNTPAH